jgi:hypothetical protein
MKKDDHILVAYKPISSEKEMLAFAREMIEYAEQHPFDVKKATAEAFRQEAEGSVECEMRDMGMLRVRGSRMSEEINQYNRFVFLDTPLQLTYVEMDALDGIVQLTIVNNMKIPLPKETIEQVAEFFIDIDQPAVVVETPPHVSVIVQKKEHVRSRKA